MVIYRDPVSDNEQDYDAIPHLIYNYFNKGNLETPVSEVKIGLKLNILVADDNQINRLLIDKVLKRWDVVTTFAENGLIAIHELENNQNFDLVLMDIHMPGMGGLEAAKIIRAKQGEYYRQIPIIALTAAMLDGHQMDMIVRAGMNDYVLKPFDPKTLYDKLSKYSK